MLWVKRQPCLMRGIWGRCEGRVEADHAGRRGAGRKAHDSTCIPLCRYHHGSSRFPRSWPQAQRRAWLHAAIVYTQACARAAGVDVSTDPGPWTEYPATPVDVARLALAAIVAAPFVGISRELPVRLTDLERLELADRKAVAEDEIAAHQHRMAEVRREMAKQGSELARRIGEMGTALRERQERRVVACYERWANGQIEVVHRDIDPRDPASIVDRRPATLQESQHALAGLSGTAPAATADARPEELPVKPPRKGRARS
jgi:hypothetical protein